MIAWSEILCCERVLKKKKRMNGEENLNESKSARGRNLRLKIKI